jgi:hypothetical protein
LLYGPGYPAVTGMYTSVIQADARRRTAQRGGREMTADSYPASQGKDMFASRLKKFHSECLRPSYKNLAQISRELPRLYPDFEGDLRHLSPAAISEILNGRRERPPDPGWVASFVLSCQRWAWRMRMISDDPGPGSLPQWYAALSAAHAGPPERCAQPALLPPSTVRLTPSQCELLVGYGSYGLGLLGQIQAGLPDAVYRAALLLAADPAHAGEAQPLLLQAGAAGHSAALELLDANDGRPGPLDAARHAVRLAAEASATQEEALACYQCAATAALLIARFATARLGQHEKHQTPAGWQL